MLLLRTPVSALCKDRVSERIDFTVTPLTATDSIANILTKVGRSREAICHCTVGLAANGRKTDAMHVKIPRKGDVTTDIISYGSEVILESIFPLNASEVGHYSTIERTSGKSASNVNK